MNRVHLASADLVLTALCSPTAAQAARLLPVVRSVGAGSDKAAALVGYYLRQALSADERYELADLDKGLGNLDKERALRAFGQAEELLRRGREAYDTLELDVAAATLSQALGRFEHYVAYVNDFEKLAEALMLLGATHVLRGEDMLGAKRLEQAVGIYPAIEPDPRIFNPSMRKLFGETVERARVKAIGTLALSSTPNAAEVYVDGRFVGVTPLALGELREGRHWLRVATDGYRPWGKVVEVGGQTELTDSAQLRPMARFNDFDEQVEKAALQLQRQEAVVAGSAAVQLGDMVQAEQLLLAQVRLDGEKVRLQLQQVGLSGKRSTHRASHTFIYDGRLSTYEREVVPFWQQQFGDAGAAVVAHAGAAAPVASATAAASQSTVGGLMHAGEARCLGGARCSSVKWATVGITGAVGVGLMAVGGIEWSRAKQTANDYAKQLQVSAAAATTAVRGKSIARTGDLFFGVGAIVSLTSLALLTWWDPTPNEAAFVPVDKASAPALSQLRLLPLPGGALLGAAGRF